MYDKLMIKIHHLFATMCSGYISPVYNPFATCISMCQRQNHLRSVRSVPHKPICVRRGADQKLDLGRCVTMDFTTSNWESIVKESPMIYVIFFHLVMSFLSPRLFMSWTHTQLNPQITGSTLFIFLQMKTLINDTLIIH